MRPHSRHVTSVIGRYWLPIDGLPPSGRFGSERKLD
jgi:hypothetical protein